MSMAIFCIANNEFQAETIVTDLRGAGLADNDISVLFPDKEESRGCGRERRARAPACALMGAGALGVIGGIAGLLAAIGPAAALAGVALGAVLGAIVGAPLGMGSPEYVAKRCEGKVETATILISVHADGAQQATRVKNICCDAGAQDIAMASEAEVPAKRFVQRARGNARSELTVTGPWEPPRVGPPAGEGHVPRPWQVQV